MIRRDPAIQLPIAATATPSSPADAVSASASRTESAPPARRIVPMGTIVAALLMALCLPAGPVMAAAIITGDGSGAIRSGLSALGSQQGPSAPSRLTELRRLKRLSAALLDAIRPAHDAPATNIAIPWNNRHEGAIAPRLDHDRHPPRAPRCRSTDANLTFDLHALPGGMRHARAAGLIALPPPIRA